MEGCVEKLQRQRESSRLRASLGGNDERIACGVCTAAVNQGHRVVRLPRRDGNHVLHARCVLEAVRNGGAQRGIQASFVCSERGCGARHRSREALEAAVQAGPGLRYAAVALTGRPDEGHHQGLYYRWDQDGLGVVDPLDRVSLADLHMRFITVVKVKPNLATTHAKLITHSLGLVNHALGAHPPSGSTSTPNSLLCALKL